MENGEAGNNFQGCVTDDDNDEKRVQSFKKLAISLLGTIEWIVGHPDYFDQVDADKIEELEDKLSALKRLISQPDTDDDEE